MSQTVSITHYNIRTMVDDLDPEARAISTPRLAQLVDRKVRSLVGRVLQPLNTPTTIALVAGTFDYNLSTIPSSVRQLILNSNGLPLDRLSLPELNTIYAQDTAVAVARGTPRHYALFEIEGNVVRVRIGPTPVATDTVDVYYDYFPAFSPTDMSATIGLNEQMMNILEKSCAAECIVMMDDADLARRKLNRQMAALWSAEVERMIGDENWRHRMYESQETVDLCNPD
jgi:hypothetical protein